MNELKRLLIDQIRSGGPIPFEVFQSAALYHPDHGFFSHGELRSTKAGDFLTSPEVSPMFGATLAEFVANEAGGDLEGVRLVEVGAGSGSLLASLLDALPSSVESWAVEVSPMARQRLEDRLPDVTIVASLDDVPLESNAVIVANELIDNLPVAIAVRHCLGWRERWVGTEDDELVLVDSPARSEVAAWCDRFAGSVPEAGLVEVQLEAAEWLDGLLSRLHSGAVVVVDYGDTTDNLEPRRVEGTLRTYRAHHLGPHPLDEPGETDITVDVNFTALQAVATEAGATVEYHRQDDFLIALGLRERLSELRQKELALARDGDPMERLIVRSRKTEVETLLHPRGLGDFRVLIARK